MPCLNPSKTLQPTKESLDAAPDLGVHYIIKETRSTLSLLPVDSFFDSRCDTSTCKVHHYKRRVVLGISVNTLWPVPWSSVGTSDFDVL
jgi:hypothetical protein